jgi:hypothetical protein
VVIHRKRTQYEKVMLVLVKLHKNDFGSERGTRPSLVETNFSLYNIFLNLTKSILNNVLNGVCKEDLRVFLDTFYVAIDSIITNF